MKAYLMFRDRDFDPEQLLTKRERAARSRSADNGLNLQQILPWNAAELSQDLGLDVLFNTMASGDTFLFEVAKVAVLSSTTDLDTIRYRQAILSDCLKNAVIVGGMYQIALDAIEGERKSYWSYAIGYPGGILRQAISALEMFVGMLRRLRAIGDEHATSFESEGFTRLLSMLKEELSDEYFERIGTHLRRLRFREGTLISAELGTGNKGKGYALRRPKDDNRSLLTRLLSQKPPAYTFRLHPRDEAGARALTALSDRGVNLVANALAQSTEHILSFFQMLRTELAFYVGCLNLHQRLVELGGPVCRPVLAPAGERNLSFSQLYDVSLALSVGRRVVGNDLAADGKQLFIITGANAGGKTTLLRSVGLAHLMMQAGMFVAAESFRSEVCQSVFTHYKREEDKAMESGKWDEELSRMSEMVDNIGANAVVLFNESFASTNEREGSEIAAQIVRALLEGQVKIFFVTHLYHFAQMFASGNRDSATFLRAERLPDGTRPFKLVEKEPLQTSYGADLYRTIFGDAEEPEGSYIEIT